MLYLVSHIKNGQRKLVLVPVYLLCLHMCTSCTGRSNLRAVSMIPLFFISSFVLLPSPVALSVLWISFSAFGPLSGLLFSHSLHFRKGSLFCVALGFFERLRDEYFSWWYVQHIPSCGTGITLYAFILYFWLFLSILLYIFFNLVLKRQTETVNGTSIS